MQFLCVRHGDRAFGCLAPIYQEIKAQSPGVLIAAQLQGQLGQMHHIRLADNRRDIEVHPGPLQRVHAAQGMSRLAPQPAIHLGRSIQAHPDADLPAPQHFGQIAGYSHGVGLDGQGRRPAFVANSTRKVFNQARLQSWFAASKLHVKRLTAIRRQLQGR
jgi:hypothetical protein